MMRSLFSGVSGLKAHQTRMDTIGNNIANVNTTGFKSSRTTFADTLSQTLTGASAGDNDTVGGTNPKQIGLGTGVASIDTIFTDGSVQSTGKNTDLCLSGNGLFVVSKGDQTYYTRDGAFEFDADGNYVLPSSGMFVKGWTAQNGSIDTSSEVGKITVESGKSMAAKATATGTYANNLNSAALTISSITGGGSGTYTYKTYSTSSAGTVTAGTSVPVTLTLSDGTTVAGTSGKSYTVGDTYSSSTATYTTSGAQVTVGSDTTPVKVTLANGTTKDVSTADANWSYGYSTSTAGDSATASTSTGITMTLDDGSQATGVSGKSYTVGGTCDVAATGTVTATTSHPVTLTLADGSTHVVTSGAYTIGTDNYTYTGSSSGTTSTSTVASATQAYTINSMDVETKGGGTGTTVTVGGTASYTDSTSGDTATASASNKVTLNLADGTTAAGVTGTTYKVGDTYAEAEKTSGSITVSSTNSSTTRLYLADGTYVDSPAANTYTVGDTYTYTSASGGKTVTTTVAGYASTSTIASLKSTSTIDSIEATKSIKISSMSVGALATSTASTDSPVTLKMSDGTTVTETSGNYTVGHSLPVTTTLTVYDTLSNKHSIPVFFTKTATDSTNGNTWTVSLATDGSGSSTLTESDGTTKVAMADTALKFTTEGKYSSGSGTATLTLTNGSTGTQSVVLDLSSLTQYSGNSTVNGTTDGHAAGKLSSVSIDSTGTITGTYSNGVKQTEAQVAVAQFNNASGLTKTGNSLYQESNNSGTANVKTASDLGVTITPSALEMSNVDIANEFSDMIITQRGFQSNSKIITVGDEMLETLIGMKR